MVRIAYTRTRSAQALPARRHPRYHASMTVSCADPYDPANIFARILRGEIPSERVYEDAHVLAFRDIHPLAPIHVLVIPKTPAVGLPDFAAAATDADLAGFVRGIAATAHALGLEPNGYRVVINAGGDAGQEVPHLHAHIFGGRPLGPMLAG